jgi:hypothetical protein
LGRGKRLRLAQRRRQKSLLKMSVVSAGTDPTADNAASMANEVKHCHAALLYADEVQLISPRAALMKSAAHFGSCSAIDLVRLMVTVGPSIAPESTHLMELVQALINVPQWMLLTEELRGQHQDLMASLLRETEPMQALLEENAQALLKQSGFDELQLAIDEGILSIDDVYGADIPSLVDEGDPMLVGFMAKIQEVLTSGNVYPLFDADASNLVRTGVKAGIFTPVKVARRLGSDAAMASGLFDRLPNFPYATTNEIIGIRRELALPLQRFRQGVRGLTEAIQVPPESDEFAHEIEDAWHLTVAPALNEIDESIQSNSSLRNLLSRSVMDASTSLPTLTAGGTLAASLAVAAGPAITMPLAAGAAVGLTVNAVRAFMAQSDELEKATGTQFYFLYGTNARLGLDK